MQKTLKTIAVVSLLSAFNGKSTKNWDGDKWKLVVWLIRFVKGLYQIQLRSDYIQAGFSSYLNSSIMWHDQKSHLREASEQSGIGDFFFVSTATRALLHFSDQNRQRVFFSELRCRSSVNRQWSHFCRQIWATVYYHRTWTSLPFEFSQKKIAWLDLGENETFLSSANSRSKVESLIQRQIKMILQLFEKKRDTQCWKINSKSLILVRWNQLSH